MSSNNNKTDDSASHQAYHERYTSDHSLPAGGIVRDCPRIVSRSDDDHNNRSSETAYLNDPDYTGEAFDPEGNEDDVAKPLRTTASASATAASGISAASDFSNNNNNEDDSPMVVSLASCRPSYHRSMSRDSSPQPPPSRLGREYSPNGSSSQPQELPRRQGYPRTTPGPTQQQPRSFALNRQGSELSIHSFASASEEDSENARIDGNNSQSREVQEIGRQRNTIEQSQLHGQAARVMLPVPGLTAEERRARILLAQAQQGMGQPDHQNLDEQQRQAMIFSQQQAAGESFQDRRARLAAQAQRLQQLPGAQGARRTPTQFSPPQQQQQMVNMHVSAQQLASSAPGGGGSLPPSPNRMPMMARTGAASPLSISPNGNRRIEEYLNRESDMLENNNTDIIDASRAMEARKAAAHAAAAAAARNRYESILRAEKMAALRMTVDRAESQQQQQQQQEEQDYAAFTADRKAAAQAAAAQAARDKYNATLRAEKMAAMGMSMDRATESMNGMTLNDGGNGVQQGMSPTGMNQPGASNHNDPAAAKAAAQAAAAAAARNKYNATLRAEKMAALGMSMDRVAENNNTRMNNMSSVPGVTNIMGGGRNGPGGPGSTQSREQMAPPSLENVAALKYQQLRSENMAAMSAAGVGLNGPSLHERAAAIAAARAEKRVPRRGLSGGPGGPMGAMQMGINNERGLSPMMIQSGGSRVNMHPAAAAFRGGNNSPAPLMGSGPGNVLRSNIANPTLNYQRNSRDSLQGSNHSLQYPPHGSTATHMQPLEKEEMISRHSLRPYSPYPPGSGPSYGGPNGLNPPPQFYNHNNSYSSSIGGNSHHYGNNSNSNMYGSSMHGDGGMRMGNGMRTDGGMGMEMRGEMGMGMRRDNTQSMMSSSSPSGFGGTAPYYDRPASMPDPQGPMMGGYPPHNSYYAQQGQPPGASYPPYMQPPNNMEVVRSPTGPGAFSMPNQGVASLHQQSQQPPPDQMIEIVPGTWLRLRGADETWACIERDFYLPVMCFGCSAELCCIQDADYVLCPTCRVVSPMNGIPENDGNAERGNENIGNGGVGLGFTFTDLMRWQSEILARRRQQQSSQQKQQRPGVYAA